MSEVTVWLDRLGEADLPVGATLVATEVEFLRHAPERAALMVRGQALCQWAAEFYRGRGATVQEAYSPIRALQRVIADLGDDQARELLERLGEQRTLTHDQRLSARRLLEVLYPMGPWGDEAPSRQHAAAWLLWLLRHRPSAAIQAVLTPLLTEWRNAAATPERALYEASDAQAAYAFLCDWLAISERPVPAGLGEFPVEEDVPRELINEARQAWQRRVVETGGAFFDSLSLQPIPRRLLHVAAAETASYMEQHPQRLSTKRLNALAPLLEPSRRRALIRLAPPSRPSAPPTTVPEVLTWFERAYLPYRRWQTAHGGEDDASASADAIRCFADWYLAHYPQALAGGPLREHLSFRQPLHGPDDQACTLVVVLDGLHADDGLYLRQLLEELAPQLDWLEVKWVFAPLPTVTLFTKQALLTGLPPNRAVGQPPRAEVIPDRTDPTKRLAATDGSQQFFWRLNGPDDIYHHRNISDFLPEEVEVSLLEIAKRIAKITRDVPDAVTLRIVLTSDHGRLLDKVPRTIPVPEQMTSHGRAAWGERHHAFDDDASGLAFEDDVAYLHGARFGLPDDVGEVAVIIGPHMFKTNDNRAGGEAYPHGGLSPEEVIVPWWVLERGWQPPHVAITVRGRGIAGGQGQAAIYVTNPGDLSLTLDRLNLHGPRGAEHVTDVDLAVRPRDKAESAITIAPWPSPADAEGWTAEATLLLSSGKRFTVQPTVELTSEEMYGRDNILEDLT